MLGIEFDWATDQRDLGWKMSGGQSCFPAVLQSERKGRGTVPNAKSSEDLLLFRCLQSDLLPRIAARDNNVEDDC